MQMRLARRSKLHQAPNQVLRKVYQIKKTLLDSDVIVEITRLCPLL